MERETRVIARVDAEKYRRMKYLLLDDKTDFSKWLRARIDEYLAAGDAKKKRGKRKEG